MVGLGTSLDSVKVSVNDEIDAIGREAWRIKLTLSENVLENSSREDRGKIRKKAVTVFDDWIEEFGEVLEGSTVAVFAVEEWRV